MTRAWLWRVAACALACLIAFAASAARRDYYFQTLDHRQNLAQSSITALLQDRAGFMWVATQAGLQRYDGYRFRPLSEMLADPSQVPRGFVTALAEDEAGRLWLGTRTQGMFVLDATRSALTAVGHGDGEDEPRHDRIDALHFQPGVGMWVGSAGGIALLQPGSGAREDVLRFRRATTPDPHVHGIAVDAAGQAWGATDEGLFVFAVDSHDARRIALPDVPVTIAAGTNGMVWIGSASGLWQAAAQDGAPRRVWPADATGDAPAASVITLAADLGGVVWAALSDASLLRFDPATGIGRRLPHQPGLDGGAPDARLVTAMTVDRSDLLWIGGNIRGVAIGDVRGATFQTIVDLDPQRDRLVTNYVRALFEVPDGRLWIGTEGDGLKRYDIDADRFESFEPLLRRALADGPGRSAPLRVQGIAPADGTALWVSTDRGLFHVDADAGRVRREAVGGAGASLDQPLRALLRRRDGSLWIAVWNQGLARYEPATGRWTMFRADPRTDGALGNAQVLTLFEDADDRLWIGSMDGLDLYLPQGDGFRRFRHDPADAATLSGAPVRALHQSRDGTLWVGSHNGLDRIVEGGGSIAFERYGERIGLRDPVVYGIAEDGAGFLWLSGHSGITRIDRNSGAVRRYGLRSGLQDLEFNGGATLRLHDGRIVFGGVRGINLFRPESIRDSAFAPPIALIGATVGNTALPEADLPPSRRLALPQSARILRLIVAALDFAAPGENRFAFKLDGFDADWVEAGAQPHATYTNLAAGDYLFRVRATNRDGVWSPHELKVPVRVVPPWWNSAPARAAYLAGGSALLLGLVFAQRRRRAHRRELMAQLREREERLKLSLWGSGDEFWDWDVRANRIYRMGADQLLGMRDEHEMSADEWRTRAVHPDDLPRVQQILQEHILGKSESFESEHRIRNAHGEWIWVRSRGKVVERDAQNNPLRIAGTAHDISASRRAERERRIASEVLRSMSEAVAVTSLDFRFVSVNASFSRITGYDEEEVIGLAAGLLNSTQNSDEFYRRQREALEADGHWKGEMWLRRRDGEEFLAWMEISQVGDSFGGRSHYVAVLNDITDKKRAEQELRYLANYDTLTGLPNRSLLAERLARAVVRARRMESRVAVLFLDLDRFKDINDSLGHAAGDRILKSAAARLLRTVGSNDTVARLGGDEFTVVIEDIGDIARAEAVAQNIVTAFAEPLDIDGRSDVTISPSIGISLYPDHGLVPTDLLKFADTAMYQAKDRGRNTWQVYTEEMDAQARRRAVMIAALRKALDRGEFSLEFQPRLSLIDNHISGVEALLRWNSTELGPIAPSVFVPIAEETGLILPIGEWVLREACMTLQRWNRHALDDIGMAVNVSVLQLLRGNLPDLLRRVLAEIDIPPARLELEVTESMVMANAEQTISVLRELKDIGVSLAIDDFGTGYSSLIYLKRLPIDTLKIDKEFVGDLTHDPDDEAITATVITMAHSLGLNVVAEGVETEEQLMYLREQGCDEIQGFWLSPALDVHHCLAFIRNFRAQTRTPGADRTAG
ncbi:EAL domain-containing protein [Chiayiivirga flava]|uniref:Diguanylate cyclase (GGDEF)-like protein/PAS domain S-box-containing protein n=1 Tax=Chiayiivirga flava TaxID=659595 RepID=A0A7W8D718_9GAMM|nr:EAL domain-containing protein [Chiayiivirga flava]MBB5207975.1 diguanylate cyclase (GGDEF)-like protein/PAS domain S-box-containing protein [Chiayiivirga flava]